MAGVKWAFRDPLGGATVVLLVNPKDATLPGYERQLTYQALTANAAWEGGVSRAVVFEGAERRSFRASGTLADEPSYAQFVDWFRRRHAVVLTDDLARQFVVYVKTFRPKRVWSRPGYVRHSYEFELSILSSPTGDL